MRLYMGDTETYYIRDANNSLWELLRDFPPMLISPRWQSDGRHRKYLRKATAVEFAEVPEWVQVEANELAERGYLGEELTE